MFDMLDYSSESSSSCKIFIVPFVTTRAVAAELFTAQIILYPVLKYLV